MKSTPQNLKGNVDLMQLFGGKLKQEIEENRTEVIRKMKNLADDLSHWAEQFESGREIEELNLTKSKSIEIDELLLKLAAAEKMMEQLS